MFFTKLDDARALLRSNGVFYQRDIYHGPERRLYASWGGGFIRIGGVGGGPGRDATSNPKVAVEALDLPFTPVLDELKRPLLPSNF